MASSEHQLFFASRVENGVAYLDVEESRHAMSVLRFSAGDALFATDGTGAIHECAILTNLPGALSCKIVSTKKYPKPICTVGIFIGLCDRDIFEGLAQDLSALGAAKIVPMQCRFSQKPWWKEWDKHALRVEKKLVAGIKQSRNPWLPLLTGPMEFADVFSKTESTLIIAAEAGAARFTETIDAVRQAAAISCFIGPPGGFAPDELEKLRTAGAVFVSLSDFRLRTELAAVALCAAVKMACPASA
jgi:16S rRNA (uracil1498-N3)-methyltransferase